MIALVCRAASVLAVVMLLAVLPAAAADRVALVIGNGAYKFANALPNPVNDATDITAKLKTLGFEVYGGNDLDLVGMQGAVRQFAENSPGAKVVMFFYAGHGMEVNGKNYLIPVDAKLESATSLTFEVLDANIILNFMVEEKRIAVALLDACRDNPLARSFKKKSRSAVGSGLAEVKVEQVGGGGLLYGLATGPGDTAADGEGRNSPFTKALLKHIATPGVEFEQMMKSVKRDVDTDTKGDQRPYLTSSLVEDLYLVPSDAKADKKPEAEPVINQISRIEQEWELVKNSKSVTVLEAFLAKHGDDALYRGLAEERIAELGEPQVAVAQPEPPALIDTPSAVAAAATATEIKVAGGYYRKRGNEWIETDLNGNTKFTFMGSVATGSWLYMLDKSRNMLLLFDFDKMKVFFRVGNDPMQPLYDIESSSAASTAGQNLAVAEPTEPAVETPKPALEEISPTLRTVALGKWPEGMAFDAENGLWVAESGARQIVKVDLATGETVAKAPAGRLPVSMTSDAAGTVYAATFTDGKLWRQPPTGKGKSIWQLKSKAHVFVDIAAGDDAVFAAHYTDAEQRMTSLSRINPESGKAQTSEPFIGEGRALRVVGGAPWLLMANSSLGKYDPQTLEYQGGADSNNFLWSMTANANAIYTAGKTAQTPEGVTIVFRHDINDAQNKLEQSFESNELILTMAATDTRVAALGENGSVWILDAKNLAPLKHFNTGASPRAALFHNGQLFITVHQGGGENGSLLIYDGLTD